MIRLYSGTPGSGKSYHATKRIYELLKKGKSLVISNFDINRTFKRLHYDNFVCLENISVDILKELTSKFIKENPPKSVDDLEHKVYIFIDEAQLVFNSRDWKNNQDWCKLFSVHRHLGMQFVLISQFDKMIDKQIRACIETEIKHRKCSNYNLFFWFLSLPFGGKLFVSVDIYYPTQDKVGSEFFIYKERIGKLYDTFKIFE